MAYLTRLQRDFAHAHSKALQFLIHKRTRLSSLHTTLNNSNSIVFGPLSYSLLIAVSYLSPATTIPCWER